MIEWFLSKFRKHEYVFINETETWGRKYFCRKCGEVYYLPLEWVYQISEKEIKNARGCKPI